MGEKVEGERGDEGTRVVGEGGFVTRRIAAVVA